MELRSIFTTIDERSLLGATNHVTSHVVRREIDSSTTLTAQLPSSFPSSSALPYHQPALNIPARHVRRHAFRQQQSRCNAVSYILYMFIPIIRCHTQQDQLLEISCSPF